MIPIPNIPHPGTFLVCLLTCWATAIGLAQPLIQASLQVDAIEQQYLVRATCTSASPDTLDLQYVMRLAQPGAAARERTGAFTLLPGQRADLGTYAIPRPDSNGISLTLTIFDGSRVLARDSFPRVEQTDVNPVAASPDLQSDSASPDPTLQGNQGIVLGGFVLEQTKTPWGQQFYELFAQQWQQLDIQTSYNILIEELPFRGRNTLVEISVDDQLIFTQLLQPKYDFLVELAGYTVQLSAQQIQQLEQVGRDVLLESKDDIDIY
jgi:hypothetical protein